MASKKAKGRKGGGKKGDPVVIDLGAYSIKAGFGGKRDPAAIVQNCAVRHKREKKLFVGDQLDSLVDHSNLFYFRPFEKGFPINWTLEQKILNRVFGAPGLKIKSSDHPLLLTEPLFMPEPLQKNLDEVVFETYGVPSLCRIPACRLAVRGFQDEMVQGKGSPFYPPCCVVVDCGYSFTHVVPLLNSFPEMKAIRRINVGGKHLTNYFKEVVSYRHFNMMDETITMNQIKEELCYVSLDFMKELERARNPRSSIVKNYVLPNARGPGRVVQDVKTLEEDEQVLPVGNERIRIPEMLFHPSDIGINQAGIAETIVESIEACPKKMQGVFYGNILLVGGSAQLGNFKERVEKEVRALAPDDFRVRVFCSEDPTLTSWRGGSIFANDAGFADACVSKAEYQEHGERLCQQKFFPYATENAP